MKKSALVVAILAVAAIPASAQIFTTGDAALPITDFTGTLVDCQSINVPSSIVITSVEVEVTAAHSWVGDLTYELTHPDGTTKLTVMNRPGRNGAGAGNSDDFQDATPIRYSNVAPSGVDAETVGDAPCTGVIDGSADCPDNYLPAPDATDTPIAGLGTDLDDFNGSDAMGTWVLCAGDSANGDTGTLTSWRLGVNVAVPVELMGFSID